MWWHVQYIWSNNHSFSGLFFMWIICRWGDMLAREGIFVMFLWNAYFLCTSVSRPPLIGMYGNLCWMHLVSTCMLLKIILYYENRFWIYWVDLVVVNLVFRMMIMTGISCEWWIMSYMLGSVMFNDEAFHVMIWLWWLEFWIYCGGGGGGNGGVGGGCVFG